MSRRKALIVSEDKPVISFFQRATKSLDLDLVVCNDINSVSLDEYIVVLLNVDLNDPESLEKIKAVRDLNELVFISVVSEECSEGDIVNALECGADECFTKPLNMTLLLAKHRTIFKRLARHYTQEITSITAGPFRYDVSTLRFYKNGKEIPLSSKENAVVKLFMDNADTVFTKDYIYSKVWGSAIIDENTIMVYMNRIRQKIEDNPVKPKYLQTVRGVGYKLNTK